jgi:hypothetical protein
LKNTTYKNIWKAAKVVLREKLIVQNLNIRNKETGIVVHICNPSYLGGRNRRVVVQGQPGQKGETLAEKY